MVTKIKHHIDSKGIWSETDPNPSATNNSLIIEANITQTSGSFSIQVFSGSHTTLADGSPSILAGPNTTVNVNPNGATEITASVTSTSETPISPSVISTTETHDYNPAGFDTATILRLSSSVSATITGLDATSKTNERIVVINVGTMPITFKNESTGSIAGNRIIIPGFETLSMDENDVVHMWNDGTSNRWRII